ncbi:MAG TPA: hypothetical protein VI138_02680, partial [Candidatus Dormibacteraeota bacterium]
MPMAAAARSNARLPFLAAGVGLVTFVAAVVMVIVVAREFGTDDALWVAVWVGTPVVGAMTAALRPHHSVGWLMLAVGAVGVASQFCYSYAPGRPISDLQALLIGAGDPLLYLAMILVCTLVLMFPDGTLAPGWRRHLLLAACLTWLVVSVTAFVAPTLS